MGIRRIYAILLIVAVFGLAGCGGQGPEPTPTPTKTAVAMVAAEVAPTSTPSPVPVVATATPAPQAVSREDELGAVVFLLSRTSWADVAGGVSLLYEVSGSNDAADFSRLGEDLLFEFALTP